MACYHLVRAFKCANGEVVFSELSKYDIVRALWLPCGQCIGCRLEKSRQWATRCMHEARLYEDNSFITLTYNDKWLPKRPSLEYGAFQRFMKRLRRAVEPTLVRFYMCGEYGPLNGRPHFHACVFNYGFPDRVFWKTTEVGDRLYTSALLESLWPFGFSSVGELNFRTAAYTARYCMEKVNGYNSQYFYARQDEDGVYFIEPEFCHMSLKPGIGAGWLAKYKADVYPHDYVVVNGVRAKPPAYYDKIYERENPEEFETLKFERDVESRLKYADNTPERHAVREQVATAMAKLLKRQAVK